MITVSKNVLKARMLEYFRRVQESGVELIVTDHRKPVLKVVPLIEGASCDELFSDVRGRMKSRGSLWESTQDEWPEV